MERFLFKYLPACYEVTLAVLPKESLFVDEPQLISRVVSSEAELRSDVVVRWERLPWIVLFKEIGAPEVKLLVSEQISEFLEIHEPADNGVVWRLRAVGMGNHRHGLDHSAS